MINKIVKRPLWLKIFSFFLIILAVNTIVLSVLVPRFVENGVKQLSEDRDRVAARQLANMIQGIMGEGNSIEESVKKLQHPGYPLAENRMMARSADRRMGRMMAEVRENQPFYLITDEKGSILHNSFPANQLKNDWETRLDDGIPILAESGTAGYVYSGTMIHENLDYTAEIFMNSFNRSLLITIIISLFLVLFLAIIFIRQITRPLNHLTRATEKVESGNYGIEIDVKGADEISLLSFRFNKMIQALERNRKWKKQIISDTAHELRTPVSLMAGTLEMIKDGVYTADETRINSLSEETELLTRLIEELRQLSDLEGESFSLEKERFSLNQLINDIIAVYHHRAENENKIISAALEWNDDEIFIDADRMRVRQVVVNYLENAIKYSPEESKIEIKPLLQNSFSGFSVDDSGPGIPEEEREKVWERFYRTDSSRNRKTGGRGLGLAISAEIIRQHNGKFNLEKSPLGGASFSALFPKKS